MRERDAFLVLLGTVAATAFKTEAEKRRPWDESQVNRHPAGVTEGGRFAPEGGGGTLARPAKPAKPPAKPAKPGRPATPPKPPRALPNLERGSQQHVNEFNGALDVVPPEAVKYLQANGVQFKAPKSIAPLLDGMKPDGILGIYKLDQWVVAVPEYITQNGKQVKNPDVGTTVAHETAHALDHMLGKQLGYHMATDNPAFAKAHAADMAALAKKPKAVRDALAYYTDPSVGRSETFAEIFAEYSVGLDAAGAANVTPYFPQTKAIVLNVLQQMWQDSGV